MDYTALTMRGTKQKPPVKHHYIPQMYLEGFCIDGENMFVLDTRADPAHRIRPTTKAAVAFENHLYAYETKNGEKETLEDFFCLIEGKAKSVIEKLSLFQEITDEERAYFSLFLSYLWMRTPTAKQKSIEQHSKLYEQMVRMMFRFPQQKELMKKFLEERGEPQTDEQLDDLIDFATNEKRSRVVLEETQNGWIKQMLELGYEMYPTFFSLDWEIIHTKEKYAFITSDNPFFIVPSIKTPPIFGLGLLTPGAKKILPLTASMCLVMHEQSEQPQIIHKEADKAFFRQINDWVYKRARHIIMSPVLGKLEKMNKERSKLLLKK